MTSHNSHEISNKPNSNYRPPAQQGKGQQKGKPNQNSAFVKKTVYVAETGENADDAKDDTQDDPAANDEPNENDEDAAEGQDDPEYPQAADDDEDGQDGDVFHELQEAANCLTVTARRLQGLTLGRKFTGGKTIKQRKQESHCSVCGEKGHWKGDPECSATADSKGNDNSRGKTYGKTSAGSSSQNKPPAEKGFACAAWGWKAGDQSLLRMNTKMTPKRLWHVFHIHGHTSHRRHPSSFWQFQPQVHQSDGFGYSMPEIMLQHCMVGW